MKASRFTLPFTVLLAAACGFLSSLPFRQVDPENAVRVVSAREKPGHKTQEVPSPDRRSTEERVIEFLTTDDPAVLRRAFESSLSTARNLLDYGPSPIWFIAERWAAIDPEGMFQYMMATGGLSRRFRESYRYGFAESLFSTWAESDPDVALAAALELNRHPRFPDNSGLGAVIMRLLGTDTELLGRLVGEHPDEVMGAIAHQYYWAADKGKLADLAAGLATTFAQEQDLQDIVRKWLSDETRQSEAKSWILRQSDEVKGKVLAGLVGRDFEMLPDGILELFVDHVQRNQESAANFVSSHGERLIEEWGFVEALAWASDSLRGKPRHEALENLLERADSVELDEVISVYDALPGGRLRDSTAAVIAERLAEVDPVSGPSWIDAQGLRGRVRSDVFQAWADKWAERDKDSVVEYLNTHEPTADSEVLLRSAVGYFNQFGPDGALIWIEKLTNVQHAAEAATRTFHGWAVKGELEAARAAAEAIERTAVRKAAIMGIERGAESRAKR